MPTAVSAPRSTQAGSEDFEHDQRDPSASSAAAWPVPHHAPEPRRAPDVPPVTGDQRGHRDQVVGIGRMAEPQRQGDQHRDQEGAAREQALQPGVDVLDRGEEELESISPSPAS